MEQCVANNVGSTYHLRFWSCGDVRLFSTILFYFSERLTAHGLHSVALYRHRFPDRQKVIASSVRKPKQYKTNKN